MLIDRNRTKLSLLNKHFSSWLHTLMDNIYTALCDSICICIFILIYESLLATKPSDTEHVTYLWNIYVLHLSSIEIKYIAWSSTRKKTVDALCRSDLAINLHRFSISATFPAYQEVQHSTGTGNVGALPCHPPTLSSLVPRTRYWWSCYLRAPWRGIHCASSPARWLW
jgi:hypothetical protein